MWSIAHNDVLAFGTQLSRWDGTSWNAFVPQPPAPPVVTLSGIVAASSDNDIWVQRFGSSDHFPVVHWDGTTWLDVSPTFPSGTHWSMLWVAGPNDVWLAVQLPTPVTPDLTEIPQPALYHWTGAAWTLAPSPVDSMPGALVQPVWGSSPNDVWFFVSGSPSRLIHWDGHAWTTAHDPVDGLIYGMWGSSAVDIWAGGRSTSGQAAMWHFDGGSWTKIDFAFSGLFRTMWGTCSGDFWAVAAVGTNPAQLWHYDGTSWAISDQTAGAMTGSSPDDIWMTGPTSTTLRHRQPGFCGDGTISSGEQCDPPHQGPDGLQCGNDCQLFTCGNGVIDPGEQCDPPNSAGSTGLCDQNCQIPTCGNGVLDPGETCDPPNTTVCDSQCQAIPLVCGNGIVQPGESCEFPNDAFCQNCTWTACGGCASVQCSLGKACAGLARADQPNCYALEGCLVPQAIFCPSTGTIAKCFCADYLCSTGLLSGGCLPQLEALAHTSDPTALVGLLRDSTNIFGTIGTELSCPFVGGCGRTCSGAGSP